jgi:hypothetical protein
MKKKEGVELMKAVTKGRKKALALMVALIVALMVPQFAFAGDDDIVGETTTEQEGSELSPVLNEDPTDENLEGGGIN